MPSCIGSVFDLKGKEAGRPILVLGAASTVKYYKDRILKFIRENDVVVIGINNISHIYTPDYHLWTNNQRLKAFSGCINKKSTVIFGQNILSNNIPEVNYYKFNYTDSAFSNTFTNPLIKGDCVVGSFRVAGNLAVVLARILGAENEIYYAGVDGYSKPFNGDQHCYGNGFTDSSDMKYESDKDIVIYKCLKAIHETIPFKIITPTLFEEFYDKTILATDT